MKLELNSAKEERGKVPLEAASYLGEIGLKEWQQTGLLNDTELDKKFQTYKVWRNPSCIPITLIVTLIVLIIWFPFSQHWNEKSFHARQTKTGYICKDECKIQLVESIPDGLNFSMASPRFLSTYDAWSTLLNISTNSLDIGSFYWTLRGADIYNHSTAWEGESIFKQILDNGMQKKYQIRIAQSTPNPEPNIDTEIFMKRKAAEVRTVNFPRLLGGGVLHTKLWVSDRKHFYLGSANMDWRSLTQVKELGVLVTNCTCLAKDVSKIFEAYWFLGRENAHIPDRWPDEYSTKFNIDSPLRVTFNQSDKFNTFFTSSPPPLTSNGRTNDIDAIVDIILNAEKFVHIAVMEYFPLIIYTPKIRFWPNIDDAIRKAAIENKVSVKLLISRWKHSQAFEDYFLQSILTLSSSLEKVDIQIRRFVVPANEDQNNIPFARVNHNKYMVTDNTAYIGTSNWSGDYFTDTAGIGLIIEDTVYDRSENKTTIVTELASVFDRDWNSPYAVELI